VRVSPFKRWFGIITDEVYRGSESGKCAALKLKSPLSSSELWFYLDVLSIGLIEFTIGIVKLPAEEFKIRVLKRIHLSVNFRFE